VVTPVHDGGQVGAVVLVGNLVDDQGVGPEHGLDSLSR
jgi:hypothetical protein